MCVAANEEYYQLLMTNHSQPSVLDVSSYTIEEIDSITSEYTLRNNVSHGIIFKLIQILKSLLVAYTGVKVLLIVFEQLGQVSSFIPPFGFCLLNRSFLQ